jgi:hypothetical protein
MAQPKWITPPNDLGIVPELEYYEFLLDAYDPTGGGLTFSLVSGRLPLGLQIIPSGKIQGIPVSELSGDTDVLYRFSIRAKNTDKQVADRTFSITITNIAPPIITPKNIDLGTYFDGTLINVQLEAIDASPNASLTWQLIDGELPKGLSLSQSGKLNGYLIADAVAGPGSDPGWDDTAWDLSVTGEHLGWDFPIDLTSQLYTFTIQVDDGVLVDTSTYQLLIFPRQDLVASNDFSWEITGNIITADVTSIRSSFDATNLNINTYPLTVSETKKHYPIIITTQDELVPVRQNSYFAFQFSAIDLDDEPIKFAIVTSLGTGFDEVNIGYDTTKFSQTELTIPGGQIIRQTTYISTGSSGTIFKVANTTGVYTGLLVTMDSGLGGNRTVVSVIDSTTLILSEAPIGVPLDGAEVVISANSHLVLDEDTGWLTGRLPSQTINQVVYDFEILVYKRDNTIYETHQLFQLSVYGDLSDTINWITPSNLGTIENGAISEFYVEARSTTNKFLCYTLTPNSGQIKLPQGLQLTANGLIYGRVSFEVFLLDSGSTTIDNNNTTIDSIYEFTITASNLGGGIASSRTFTIQVIPRNLVPYENLYLKALPYQAMRERFLNIVSDSEIFDPTTIYRSNDPYFGLAKDIKFLFLPGLEANELSTYMQGVETNHFNKRIAFGSVKTAMALDTDFNIKYEVVYIEVTDADINGSTANVLDLSRLIKNPYYDSEGIGYTIAYPNGYSNMSSAIITVIDYANKGALPDWMTSNQLTNISSATSTSQSFKSPLGLTYAVVLAYTIPGASTAIAYKLNEQKLNFNSIDFTVDRYQLDNVYSKNYNISTKKYITSIETTFDRYSSPGSVFVDQGMVDYAVSLQFDQINSVSVAEVRSNGGMDGIVDFIDGEHIVFFQQEFQYISDYNYGWTNIINIWDSNPWAYNTNTLDNDNTNPALDPSPGQPWNYTNFVSGSQEHNLNSTIINKRAGVWRININSGNIVTLTFVKSMDFYDKVTVRNGHTQSGNTIYFDPTIYPGQYVPAYSLITRYLTDNKTTFDVDSTRFLSNRDMPVVPEEGDKYIKFVKSGVFT